MAKFTCDITCYNDYTGSALLHEATLWSDKTTTSSDVVTAKKDSSSTDVHTKVAMLVKDEMSSRRCMTCMLFMVLLVCAHFGSTNAFNDTAVSQTHDNVHLTEAARKARDGDSKLEDLLHWAIENSDPDQLKQQAENVATDSIYLNDRQRELIKEMQSAPTEIDLMKDTIAILTNSTTPAEEVLLALEALQSLLLVQDSTSVQAAAAFVLGTAASNNNKFQEQLMELYPESVMHLLRVTASSDGETSKKGLYALAALLRNNAAARTHFYSNSGVRRLTEILSVPEQTQQVQLKILNLVTDLSQLDLSSQASKAERQQLLAAIHPHACDGANNLASEALMAVKGVLECSDTDAKQLAEESGASSAIQSLKQGLKSHLNSICHVESYVVEDVQCKRDLLQMCNDIDNMPCLTAEDHTAKTTSKHQEL
ncbi:MAG: hypothetical protein FRX49_04378 [Trebouxia sp. A1-2]|nr:MAG: hypothetical protein FRX49_04378 [Trebouxia sp. A1-2]